MIIISLPSLQYLALHRSPDVQSFNYLNIYGLLNPEILKMNKLKPFYLQTICLNFKYFGISQDLMRPLFNIYISFYRLK